MILISESDAVVGRLYQAINKRDFDIFERLLANDWVDHLETGCSDKTGFIAAIKRVIDALPDFSIKIEALLASPLHVTARLILSGTHKGVFLGIAPTGHRLTLRAHDIHGMENGRIAESWQVEDWFSAFDQMKEPG
jgi:steroid delta-isomerase-like uncharacterized protein